MKILVAITGASGAIYAQRLLDNLDPGLHEIHVVLSNYAQVVLAEERRRLGWEESDLAGRRKNNPGKLAMAARLRRETTLPLKWIAQRAHLGASKAVNKNSHQWMQAHPAATVRQEKATMNK